LHRAGSFLFITGVVLHVYCIGATEFPMAPVSWRRAGMAGVSTHDETTQSRTLSRLSAEPHIQAPESGSLVNLVSLVAILCSCRVVVRRGARSCLAASVAPSDWPDAETRCRCQRTTTNPRLTDCDFQNRLAPLSPSTRAPTLLSQCQPVPPTASSPRQTASWAGNAASKPLHRPRPPCLCCFRV
jgi:hypothetical protein